MNTPCLACVTRCLFLVLVLISSAQLPAQSPSEETTGQYIVLPAGHPQKGRLWKASVPAGSQVVATGEKGKLLLQANSSLEGSACDKIDILNEEKETAERDQIIIPNYPLQVPQTMSLSSVAACPATFATALQMPTTQAGKKVRVGIVDTGVSPDHHTDLFGQVEYAGEAADELGHGTAVAGVVQQVFSAHVAAEHPELYAYKVIDGTGHGTLWGVLQALDRAAADSMDVVNLSLGFSGVDCVEAVQAYLDEQFATYPFELVVSAGNSSLDLDRRARLPATSTAENVLVVGAMDRQQHELAAWSNYGTNNVDYLTLGDHVSVPNHASSTFLEVSGTSFSAPIVTGLLAALLTQYDRGEALRQLAELVEPNLHSGNTAIGSIPFREDDCPAFPEAVAGGTAVAVELYPNPFVDRLMLTLPQNETGCRIALFGTSGQLVYAKNLPAGVVSSNIATQELPRGSYVLTITSQYTHETHLVRRE